MLNKQLLPLKLNRFTNKQINASGWMLDQLRTQAEGLSGNLDKFWPDIKDSKWIGGTAEGWERVPYWLDGFIPLAYLLDDEDLKGRAQKYIDAIINRQCEDGWICPCSLEERKTYDIWAAFLIAKVLVVYYDFTNDPRIEEIIYKLYKNIDVHINKNSLFNWGAFRWYEALIALYWLYERRPEDWMLELVVKLKTQGFDYDKLYANWVYEEPTPKGRWSLMNHVVNQAMAIKGDALFYRLTKNNYDLEAPQRMLSKLDEFHGLIHGCFSGDECLTGRSPVQGTELCAIVELMYSLEQLMSVDPQVKWADMLEILAFNALPATISPDMWTHQYDQMVNQVECTVLTPETKPFKTNGPYSHIFGLEPNFGCCTANFNQGWPKLAMSTYMFNGSRIVCCLLVPSELSARINDSAVNFKTITDYPFDNKVTFEVTTDKPVNIAFEIRIPSFAKKAFIDGKAVETGAFYTINKIFEGTQKIELELDFEAEFVEAPNGLFALRRGPLVYSVPILEKWKQIDYGENEAIRVYPHCDYEILPESKFNYAFTDTEVTFAKGSVDPKYPFNPQNPPVYAYANMVEIDWKKVNGVVKELPESLTPLSKPQKVKMIPYGCTNLRMTELPLLK